MNISPDTLTIKKADQVFARQVKLPNRRVGLVRDAQGNAVLVYRNLRGWKNIRVQMVGLSPEAADATMLLILQSLGPKKP